MAILGTDNLQRAHLLGAAVLQNAIAESGYAMNKEIITVHSHLPDAADIEKRKFHSAFKDRAALADETPRQKLFAAQKTSPETAANIPAYNSNQRTVNRTRQQNRSQMSETPSLKGFEIPELLPMAHSGEKLMYYDKGPKMKK